MYRQTEKDKGLLVGFFGGNNLVRTASVEEFLSFFEHVKQNIDWSNEEDRSLITDRLYKKYVKEQDIDRTSELMRSIREQFERSGQGALGFGTKDGRIFAAYEACVEDTKHFLHKRQKYVPIRITIAELPHCIIDTERPLAKLDAWDGPPFWTRFYLKELYDQGKEMPELPF